MQENTTSPCTESLHLSDWSKSTICVVTFSLFMPGSLLTKIAICSIVSSLISSWTRSLPIAPVAPNIIALIEGMGCWVVNVGCWVVNVGC